MVIFDSKPLLLTLLLLAFVLTSAAQYDNYNFRNFKGEIVSLTTAYRLALDHYTAENWTESIKYLEVSLRLHRLLKDSRRYCVQHCNKATFKEPSLTVNQDLRVYWHVTMRATCLKKCTAHFPVLQLSPPSKEVMENFSRRAPYKYLHFAHSRLNDLQRAVPCAYTYLQKNPEDQEMHQLMEQYKSLYDLSGFLTDHEERPYEVSFLKGVELIGSGDYGKGVDRMEKALSLYLLEYELCQADCGGLVCQLSSGSDPAMADIAVGKCELKCEENLKPNIGGYFVEKFVPTVYYYLQYAYYKLNDGQSAAPCASSYALFEPEDQVMKQNLQYYKAYGQEWDLQPRHFKARTEALKHYNQTVTLKQLLAFVEEYSELDDEEFFGAEEAALLASESPDVEFEGMGDYEESIYAKWRQPKGKGDAGLSNIT